MPGLYLVLSLMTLGIVTAWIGIDGPLLNPQMWKDAGFSGGIIGGAVGGLFTAFAGWLAWATSRKQIDQQQYMLALLLDERKSRLTRILLLAHERAARSLAEARNLRILLEEWISTCKTGEPNFKKFHELSDVTEVLNDQDFWCLRPDLQGRLHLIQRAIPEFHPSRFPNELIPLDLNQWMISDIISDLEQLNKDILSQLRETGYQ